MAKHNEDSRVKIPAILHIMTLGYSFLSLKSQRWDESTNIFTDLSIIIHTEPQEILILGDLNYLQ